MAKRKAKSARATIKISAEQALNLYANYLIPDLANLEVLESEYYRGISNPLTYVFPIGCQKAEGPYRICLLVRTSEVSNVTIENAIVTKTIKQGLDTVIIAIGEFKPLLITNNSTSFDIIGGIF